MNLTLNELIDQFQERIELLGTQTNASRSSFSMVNKAIDSLHNNIDNVNNNTLNITNNLGEKLLDLSNRLKEEKNSAEDTLTNLKNQRDLIEETTDNLITEYENKNQEFRDTIAELDRNIDIAVNQLLDNINQWSTKIETLDINLTNYQEEIITDLDNFQTKTNNWRENFKEQQANFNDNFNEIKQLLNNQIKSLKTENIQLINQAVNYQKQLENEVTQYDNKFDEEIKINLNEAIIENIIAQLDQSKILIQNINDSLNIAGENLVKNLLTNQDKLRENNQCLIQINEQYNRSFDIVSTIA